MHVDMRAGRERRQFAAMRIAQFEAADLGRLGRLARHAHGQGIRVHATAPCYMADRPPSTISVVSVMYEASSLASHTIGHAISRGSAQRPSKDVSWRCVFSASTLLPAAWARPMWKSVSVDPGHTALARMPLAVSSNASVRVMASMPALVASYRAIPLRPVSA